MTVKLLAEKSGALQGMDVETIARQAYGGTARYMPSDAWDGYVGAIVRTSATRPQGEFEVLDYVVTVHDE